MKHDLMPKEQAVKIRETSGAPTKEESVLKCHVARAFASHSHELELSHSFPQSRSQSMNSTNDVKPGDSNSVVFHSTRNSS
jgi:hypothetical protein